MSNEIKQKKIVEDLFLSDEILIDIDLESLNLNGDSLPLSGGTIDGNIGINNGTFVQTTDEYTKAYGRNSFIQAETVLDDATPLLKHSSVGTKGFVILGINNDTKSIKLSGDISELSNHIDSLRFSYILNTTREIQNENSGKYKITAVDYKPGDNYGFISVNVWPETDVFTKSTDVPETQFLQWYSDRTTDNGFFTIYDSSIGNTILSNFYGQHAEGGNVKAIGKYSHAEGWGTCAIERYSHAENDRTFAFGFASHTEGCYTKVTGSYSHAEGYMNTVNAKYSHAEGQRNTMNVGATASHTEGNGNTIGEDAECAHAEGSANSVKTKNSHAEGYSNSVKASTSHAEGNKNTINMGANISHAEGNTNTIGENAECAHVEGGSNSVKTKYSHAEGFSNIVGEVAEYSHIEGYNSDVYAKYSHVEGHQNTINISANASHAEGSGNKIKENAKYSHVEGNTNTIGENAECSHIEGNQNNIKAKFSHAEGYSNIVGEQAEYSHIEGYDNNVYAKYSHAEGYQNTINISANVSHAEGYRNAIGENAIHSHIEGNGNTIGENAKYSHAEGGGNVIGENAIYSHVEGNGNIIGAKTECSHTEGKYCLAGPWSCLSVLSGDLTNNTITLSNDLSGYQSIINNYIKDKTQSNIIYQLTNRYCKSKVIGVDYTTNTLSLDMLETPLTNDGYNTTTKTFNISSVQKPIYKLWFTNINKNGQKVGEQNPNTEGYGKYSHAEGYQTYAFGSYSHAEGYSTIAADDCSHTEGQLTRAGKYSHAEGFGNDALGKYSHAEGYDTQALADYSHSAGCNCTISADHVGAYIWNGQGRPNNNNTSYSSNGIGTFNINPTGGTKGFYIGAESLNNILSSLSVMIKTQILNELGK